MLLFVLRKLAARPWLTVCLAVGAILAITLLCSVPLYTQGVLQRSLIQAFEEFQIKQGRYPGAYTVRQDFPSDFRDPQGRFTFHEYEKRLDTELIPSLGLPIVEEVQRLIVSYLAAHREDVPEEDERLVLLEALQGMDAHVTVIHGRAPRADAGAGVLEAMVSEKALHELDLVLGEIYAITDTRGYLQEPLRVRVVGVFAPAEARDLFWYRPLEDFRISLFIDYEEFRSRFVEPRSPLFSGAEWYRALDYYALQARHLGGLVRTLREHESLFRSVGVRVYEIPMLGLAEMHLAEQRRLTRNLVLLLLPVLLLLFFYVYMVTRLVVHHERNDIAVLKSRGAATRQLVLSYALESVLLAAVAVGVGPPLARLASIVVGGVGGFLEFVRRPALEVHLDLKTYAYACAGAAYFCLAMLVPALLASRRTIVEHKRRRARARGWVVWKRFGLDGILLGVSMYGYYGYLTRSDLAVRLGAGGGEVPVDPVLFVLSTLFVLGVALVSLRLFPVLVKGFLRVGQSSWSPPAFAALVQVGRGASEATFFMLFLILTVSTGTFAGNAARTINWNIADKTRYVVGADVALKERWVPLVSEDPAAGVLGVAEVREPPLRRFSELAGVEVATPVMRRDGVMVESRATTVSDAYFMAVVPHQFGEVGYFRDDLYEYAWYDYLNLLTASPQGAILSTSFQHRYGLAVGDSVHVSWGGNERLAFHVLAFVDYWPTYNPSGPPYGLPLSGDREQTGVLARAAVDGSVPRSGMVVVNLDYVRTQTPMEGYEVWLALEEHATTEEFYGSLRVLDISLEGILNARQTLLDYKNDPDVQGTNGILTLGFVATLLICLVGFLVYSILSFGSRVLQFGVLRAMGLSSRRVRAMVFYEQLLTSGLALILGGLIGELTCRLFVPMLEHIFGAAGQAPPFRVVSFFVDYVKLYAVVGGSLLAGFAVLVRLLSVTRIHQAIKLGEE